MAILFLFLLFFGGNCDTGATINNNNGRVCVCVYDGVNTEVMERNISYRIEIFMVIFRNTIFLFLF